MSLRSEAVRVSESGATTFRAINTDTLVFFMMLDHRGGVQVCRLDRKTLATGVVIPCGSLADTLNTRGFLPLKSLTVSESGGGVLTSPGREEKESLLSVDTDGTGGSYWGDCCQLSIK